MFGLHPAKKMKTAPTRPENDIAFQLGPYALDDDVPRFDTKESAKWTEHLLSLRRDIRLFDDSNITPEQELVRTALIETRRNTLITGEAGTGKSFVQLSLIKTLKGTGHNVFRIGPTHASISNLNEDSMTFQTFFSMPPTVDYLVAADRKKHMKDMAGACGRQPFIQRAKHRTTEQSTLVIEEAAMISAEVVDLILGALELAAPGRIRTFFFFDILQLVPVTGSLLIESPLIMQMPTLVLTKNMRQDGDDDFLLLLRAVAKGQMDESHYQILRSRVRPKQLPPPQSRLCARNVTVDQHNLRHLLALDTTIYTALAHDIALKRMPDYSTAKLPRTLSLAVGAKIVFESSPLHAIGLHNGITGTIVALLKTDTEILLPLVHIDKYNLSILVHPVTEDIHSIVHGPTAPTVIATRTQFPFSIAEATTIHKAQGQTITTTAEVDLQYMNSPGQVYTALSRLTSLENLTLKNLPPMQWGGGIEPVRPSPHAVAWCRKVGLFR